MVARLRSWWQQINQHRIWTAVIIIASALMIALIVVVVLGYWLNWPWVGISGGNSKITTITTATEQPPAKTLWDWMQLLIIPVVLVVGGFLLNLALTTNEQKIAKQRDLSAQKLAKDNQMETLLQNYLDNMSELLIEHDLLNLDSKAEIRVVARSRTLTVLSQLDKMRKGNVIQFLHESNLINAEGKPVISLEGADLQYVTTIVDLCKVNLSEAYLVAAQFSSVNLNGANLSNSDLSEAWLDGASLEGANLSKAFLSSSVAFLSNFSKAILKEAELGGINLWGAKLTNADLTDANLTGANLTGADLTGAIVTSEQLDKAKSLKGATMPDGKMYRNSSGAELYDIDLSGVDLSGVDLSGVDLTEAKLINANLSGANLSGVDLGGANLKGVIGITTEELEKQTKSLKGATMPDGSIHP